MTSPPDGHDPVPAVAALAVQVHGLHRDIESLTSQASELASTQRQHTILLDSLAELRNQIDRILELVTGPGDDTPATWCWLTMPGQEHDEKLTELSDWVNTVLCIQYPDYTTGHIRNCWPHHPEARWELAWLYHLWTRAYLAGHPAPKDAADWHDRWAPGVTRRLDAVMRRCEAGCRRQAVPATSADTPQPPAP
ncbi:MAG: hypothetical protein ACRDNF_05560 [Streptosporangiaceae bacterium]